MPSYVRPGIRKCAKNRALSVPTLIGAVMLVITGLLLIIAGIILDVMAKNDRKTFVIDTNKIAYNKRH